MSAAQLPSSRAFAWRVAQFLGAAILFKDYVAEAALCSGESMLPTVRSEGDMLLVEKVGVAFRAIKRGDVVVCVSPSDPDKLICKRVIGLVRASAGGGGWPNIIVLGARCRDDKLWGDF